MKWKERVDKIISMPNQSEEAASLSLTESQLIRVNRAGDLIKSRVRERATGSNRHELWMQIISCDRFNSAVKRPPQRRDQSAVIPSAGVINSDSRWPTHLFPPSFFFISSFFFTLDNRFVSCLFVFFILPLPWFRFLFLFRPFSSKMKLAFFVGPFRFFSTWIESV